MALSDVNAKDVRSAIGEYKDIGQKQFLREYRFSTGKYWLIEEEARYESKAILGVAHDKFTCERINSQDYITRWKLGGNGRFSGGEQTKKKLQALGFTVRADRQPNDSHKNMGSVTHELNRILFGPPGTGKTWKATRLALAIVRGVEVQEVEREEGAQQKVQSLLFSQRNPGGRIGMVTFHQNYSYEDFVEGIRPKLSGEEIAYELRQGIFRRMADAAASDPDPDSRYVLIIDEINRGNIAKILGELITLIEASRRADADEETSVSLPYSGDTFSVPGNLYIIGTMNTADRSIQLLDTALRRRFRFEELMPNPAHEKVPDNVEGVNCQELMRAMNDRITALLDREHQIGHTNFFGIQNMEELADRFQHKIFPLLQEYFFDDWGKIRTVLRGNSFVQDKGIDPYVKKSGMVDTDHKDYQRLPDKDPEWLKPAQYQSIYDDKETRKEEES